MRQIADAVEYTPTAIYFHFRDKEMLFRRLCAEDFGKLEARYQVLARVGDPVERLRMAARAYVAFALDHPHHYRWMHAVGGASESDATSGDRESYRVLLRGVEEAAAKGALRQPFDSDQPLAAQTLWAALHGVVMLEIGRRTSAAAAPAVNWRPADERVGAAIEMALTGLLRD